MKKRIILFLLLLSISSLFTSCILGLPDFSLNKTVKIKIGEKLYTEDDIWIRLDSITQDTRNYYTNTPGRVVAEFTVGQDTSGVESWTKKITFVTDTMTIQTFDSYWHTPVDDGDFYVMTITGVTPMRMGEVDIPKDDYCVSFVLEEGMIAYKPNIYLYPKKKTKLDVSLDFPQGGEVIKSIPAFPDKWQNIKVKPSGLIDNEYEYLFYEAALPDRWQYNEGWSVMINDLETFFRQNLSEYGFVENEINDFINYWIPRLDDSPYYNIYPQYTDKVDELVTLNISKEPQSLLRMFYVIKASDKKFYLPVPDIPDFDREGFTVTEWGVIL